MINLLSSPNVKSKKIKKHLIDKIYEKDLFNIN